MADEFQSSVNWWDSSSRNNRFEAGTPPSSSSLNSLGSFGWSPDMADNIKSRPSMDSLSISGNFHDTSKLQQLSDSSPSGDPNLHLMGLGLSSQSLDWSNQTHLFTRGEKASESSFRSMLQENMNSNSNFGQETSTGQLQWRDKLFPGDSSTNVRGFSLDRTQFSPHEYSSGDSTVTSQGLPSSNFQMDSPALYGTSSSTSILQGLFATDVNNNQQLQPQQSCSSSSMNFPYPQNYGVNNTNNEIVSPSNWSNKVPQFLRTSSPPKQQPPNYSHLHFSNNAPFWNASSESSVKDVRPTFFPLHLQPQFAAQPFDEKPKVRKEKMGDRITALQQLVSPFGKTDTASVLSEAIEYIKFLHEQVSVLSTPYMKSGAAMQHQQNSDKSKDLEGPKQDLRSRGLCLVPVSSTIPVTHETTVDFWTPTFGASLR